MTMTPEAQLRAIDTIRRSLEGSLNGLQILVVEDNAKDAELTLTSLREFGLQSEWAKNMADTLRFIGANTPWLIFLDLQLGEYSGVKVLSAVKAFKSETKVVVLTGAYEHGSEQCNEALRLGAIAIMKKPLTQEQIQFIFGAPGAAP